MVDGAITLLVVFLVCFLVMQYDETRWR